MTQREESPKSVSSAKGLIIAAPASGCGKTVLTLGLLRRLKQAKAAAASFKVGPDYIDPAFHAAASGRECVNLDSWAMRPETLSRLAASLGQESEVIIGEGVMGLFDGARALAKHGGGPGGRAGGAARAPRHGLFHPFDRSRRGALNSVHGPLPRWEQFRRHTDGCATATNQRTHLRKFTRDR